MGLFGSLFTSSSGMLAASRGTQVVSENVSNMTTIGFKKSDTSFRSLVSGNSFNSDLNKGGGVTATKLLRATNQGQVQQTQSSLDAGITGNGFFAVSQGLTGDEFVYTRNGQFSEYAVRSTPDAQGLVTENDGEQTFLRNSAGFFLYGWPIDVSGNVASGTGTDSLQPVEISTFQTSALATTEINIAANLDAAETDYNPQLLGQQLPVDNRPSHFARSVGVFDANGTEHPVTFEYRKITGPMAQFTSNTGTALNLNSALVDPTGSTPAILNGDTLNISNGAETLNVTFVNAPADTSLNQAATIQDLRTVINNFTDAASAQQFNASISDNGQLLVQSIDPSAQLNISASSATVLGGGGLNIPVDPVDADYIYEPDYDIVSDTGVYANQGDFPTITNTTNPNTQGWWEVSVRIPDPAAPASGATVVQSQGLLNFNGDGTLNADGPASINLPTIDFDLATTGDELALNVDIARTSQFAGAYNVISADQNGAGIGTRTGVFIGDNGVVKAEFSNGTVIDVYQIPLATFPSPDQLDPRSGTVFGETVSSGEVTLGLPGENGAGLINQATLENSNVDLGNEMSTLIVFQRSFGLNSQVINAIDEMTQNLAQLKR